jgi:uncharacterized protein (TIGR03067 family)
MLRTLFTLGLFGLLGTVSFSLAQDDKKGPEGKWVIVSVEREGKADDALKGAERSFTSGKYTMTPKDGKSTGGTYKVDASLSPKTIDMTPDGGRYKDKLLLGIYEVVGNQLKIAFAEPGKDRPKTFESKPDSGIVLAVHERAK